MTWVKLVSLDEVLALLPEDDIVGPKPSYLRQEINKLKQYGYYKTTTEDDQLMQVIKIDYIE